MISFYCKSVIFTLATFFLVTCFSDDATAQKRRVRYVTNLASGYRHQVTQPRKFEYSSGDRSRKSANSNIELKAESPQTKPTEAVAGESPSSNNPGLTKTSRLMPKTGESSKTARTRAFKPVVVPPKDPQIGQVVPSSRRSQSSARRYSPNRVVRGNGYNRGYTIPSRSRSCLPGRG